MRYGSPRIESDPDTADDVLRRGLKIAQESGNRTIESHFALGLSRLTAMSGVTSEVLDYLTLVIRHYYDAGTFSLVPNPLAVLTALLDRIGRREPAAVISGFAATPLARGGFPEINMAMTHLREVIGDDGYESFTRQGAGMTNAGMARYALDQIDQARAELNAVSK